MIRSKDIVHRTRVGAFRVRMWKREEHPSKATIRAFRENLQALKDSTPSWSTDPVIVAEELINKLDLSCCEVLDHEDSGVYLMAQGTY